MTHVIAGFVHDVGGRLLSQVHGILISSGVNFFSWQFCLFRFLLFYVLFSYFWVRFLIPLQTDWWAKWLVNLRSYFRLKPILAACCGSPQQLRVFVFVLRLCKNSMGPRVYKLRVFHQGLQLQGFLKGFFLQEWQHLLSLASSKLFFLNRNLCAGFMSTEVRAPGSPLHS